MPDIYIKYHRSIPVVVVKRIIAPVIRASVIRIIITAIVSETDAKRRVVRRISDSKASSSINTYTPRKRLVIVPVGICKYRSIIVECCI